MSWDLFESPSTPNFWHKCWCCSWSPLVPICWTMLPFATFIDTRGLEHCWESHGTFLGRSWAIFRKVLPTQFFGTSASIAVNCLYFPYAWNIVGKVMRHFSTKIFWHKRRRCSQSPLRGQLADPKSVFFTTISFWPKSFNQFFFTKIFLTYFYKKELFGSWCF